jgi:hypothetical protein
VVPDRRRTISDNVLTEAVGILMREVQARFARRGPLGKVYVDDGLREILVPFNKRGDSASSVVVIKGSRYPILKDTKVVRLFLWWKGNVDIDLSMICFDKDFTMVDYIAWTKTGSNGCVHSGDIQNAPNGGSEFIDFDVAHLRGRGIRYVVSSVISYRGEKFNLFPCYAGFMERDALTSGATYEPASVRLKFDVSAPNTSVMPLIFDLDEMKVVFADIASGAAREAWVPRQKEKLASTTQMVLDLPNRRLTVYDVLVTNAKARGQLVASPENADIKFLVSGGETIGFDVDKVVDEYL